MGKVSYSPGIEYVSGALAKPKKQDGHNHGDYLIGTHRTAPTESSDCTRLYIRKGDAYKRSTALNENEINARNRFRAVSQAVKARKRNLDYISTDQVDFMAQRNEPGGKKTMLAYLWKVCGDIYDAQHNG